MYLLVVRGTHFEINAGGHSQKIKVACVVIHKLPMSPTNQSRFSPRQRKTGRTYHRAPVQAARVRPSGDLGADLY